MTWLEILIIIAIIIAVIVVFTAINVCLFKQSHCPFPLSLLPSWSEKECPPEKTCPECPKIENYDNNDIVKRLNQKLYKKGDVLKILSERTISQQTYDAESVTYDNVTGRIIGNNSKIVFDNMHRPNRPNSIPYYVPIDVVFEGDIDGEYCKVKINCDQNNVSTSKFYYPYYIGNRPSSSLANRNPKIPFQSMEKHMDYKIMTKSNSGNEPIKTKINMTYGSETNLSQTVNFLYFGQQMNDTLENIIDGLLDINNPYGNSSYEYVKEAIEDIDNKYDPTGYEDEAGGTISFNFQNKILTHFLKPRWTINNPSQEYIVKYEDLLCYSEDFYGLFYIKIGDKKIKIPIKHNDFDKSIPLLENNVYVNNFKNTYLEFIVEPKFYEKIIPSHAEIKRVLLENSQESILFKNPEKITKYNKIISNSKYMKNGKFVKKLYMDDQINRTITINELNMIEKYIICRNAKDNNFYLSDSSHRVFEDFFNFCIDNKINLTETTREEYYVGLKFENIKKFMGKEPNAPLYDKFLFFPDYYNRSSVTDIFNNFLTLKEGNDNMLFKCKPILYKNIYTSVIMINHDLDNQTTEYYTRTGTNNGIRINSKNYECCVVLDTEVFDPVSGTMVRQNIKKNSPPDYCTTFDCDPSKNISRPVTDSECCDFDSTEVFDPVSGQMVKQNRKKNPEPPQCKALTCDATQNKSRPVTQTECCNFDSTEVFDPVSGQMVKQNRKKNPEPPQCKALTCDATQNKSRPVTEAECCNLGAEVFKHGQMIRQNTKKNPAPPQCANFTCVNKLRNPTANDCKDDTYATKTTKRSYCPGQNPNQKKGAPKLQTYIMNEMMYSNSSLGASLCPDKTVIISTTKKC